MNRSERTFENFYSDDSNDFLKALRKLDNKEIAQKLSPMIFSGETGMGKTHLLNALENRLKSLYPEFQTMYVTGETFLDNYLSALKENKIDEFKNKYSNLDAIFIDDFNFFANKESAQEQLFYRLTQLEENGCIIAISWYKKKDETLTPNGFIDRLWSFVSSGLNLELTAPNNDTKKKKIISFFLEETNSVPAEAVIKYISTDIYSMRDLESKLNKIVCYRKLIGAENSELAIKDLKKMGV